MTVVPEPLPLPLVDAMLESLYYVMAVGQTEARASLPGFEGKRPDRWNNQGLHTFSQAFGEFDALAKLTGEPLFRCSPMELRRAFEEQAAAEYDARRMDEWRLRATLAGELS